jgi:cystathionine beta-synthase
MRGARSLVTVGPDASAEVAVERMQSRGISQLPVVHDGQAVGSIQEVTLARLLHDGFDPTAVRVGDIMARPLPQLDIGVHLDEAYRLLLSGNSGVLATSGGRVVDIITRIDLIEYWNRPKGG